MAILNVFAGSGGGVRIPLETPTSFVATPASGKILLSWTDPVDKVANPGGEAVATWNYTTVVRKVGSAPQTPGDGVEIVREHTRNQYQSTTYTDELYIENGITYHYAVFAVSTIGVWSTPATATAMSRPEEFSYHDTITITWPYSDFSHIYSAASTTNHAIFNGFAPSDPDDDHARPYIVAITKDGIANSLASNGGLLCASTSLNGNAYFAGGSPGIIGSSPSSDARTPYVRRISPSLSMSSGNMRESVSSAAAATVSDNVLIAGGEHIEGNWQTYSNVSIANVDAFNSSMTRTALQDLSNPRCAFAGASTENHAIFAGGNGGKVDGIDVSGSNFVDAYDSFLTKVSSISALSYSPGLLVARRVGGSAIFAGGANGETYYWNVESYNDSLTKQALDNMTQGRYFFAGVATDTHVLFAGGVREVRSPCPPYYRAASDGHYVRNVDVYTSSLTKETLSDLPTGSTVDSGAMAENMALFPMADGTTYRYIYQ